MELRRLVWASSGATHKGYEITGEVLDDDSPPRPSTVYGYCKLFNENMAQHYFERFEVDSVAFRPAFLTGIGRPTGLTAQLIRQLLVNPALGRPDTVPFSCDKLGWHDVTEVASLFRRALELDGVAPRRAYNLRPSQTTVAAAIEIVRRILPEARLQAGGGSNWGPGKNYSPGFGRSLLDDMGFQTVREAEDIFRGVVEQVRANRTEVERAFPEEA